MVSKFYGVCFHFRLELEAKVGDDLAKVAAGARHAAGMAYSVED